jgi:hypothetical protein
MSIGSQTVCENWANSRAGWARAIVDAVVEIIIRKGSFDNYLRFFNYVENKAVRIATESDGNIMMIEVRGLR